MVPFDPWEDEVDEPKYARLVVPPTSEALLAQTSMAKIDKLRLRSGQIVAIQTNPSFVFHEREAFETVALLGGRNDEGVFWTVPRAWLHGLGDPRVQAIGQWLEDTFWDRTEYEEPEVIP
jgi:hypothetical protein